jgi:hypothetical protein
MKQQPRLGLPDQTSRLAPPHAVCSIADHITTTAAETPPAPPPRPAPPPPQLPRAARASKTPARLTRRRPRAPVLSDKRRAASRDGSADRSTARRPSLLSALNPAPPTPPRPPSIHRRGALPAPTAARRIPRRRRARASLPISNHSHPGRGTSPAGAPVPPYRFFRRGGSRRACVQINQ